MRNCCSGDSAGGCRCCNGGDEGEEGEGSAYALGHAGWGVKDLRFNQCGEDLIRNLLLRSIESLKPFEANLPDVVLFLLQRPFVLMSDVPSRSRQSDAVYSKAWRWHHFGVAPVQSKSKCCFASKVGVQAYPEESQHAKSCSGSTGSMTLRRILH